MKELVRTKMLNDYSKLTYKKETVCVKYRYEYKDVMVNLYFDAFDPKSYTLTMMMNTEKQFYFTTLNIMNTRIRKEYLPKLSPVFLNKILVANELDDFYEHMEERILTIEPVIANYKKDKIFSQTIRYQEKIDLPFWWHMRNVQMSNETLEILSERADISRDILLKIQKQNFTLVRTDDCNKRRNLTIILEKHGILI